MLTKNKKKLFFAILIAVNIIILALAFLWELLTQEYLYPTARDISIGKWLLGIFAFAVIDLILFAMLPLFKKVADKKIFVLPIAILLLVIAYTVVLLTALLSSSNWQSSTDDVGHYGQVDEYLDKHFEIADMKLSEIMVFDTESVDFYNYTYHSELMAVCFDVSFGVTYNEVEYARMIETLSSSSELVRTESDGVEEINGEKTRISGRFELKENKNSKVDEWNEAYVYFCDDTRTVYFKFSGNCYT